MDSDRSRDASDRARAEIQRVYAQIGNPNHFQILGVERDASREEIEARYALLKRKWHVDAYVGMGLDETELECVDEIFKRIGSAHHALTDPEERAHYLTLLERQAAGMVTDVNAVLRAETLVDEGLLELRRKRWWEAESKLSEAHRLNPDDALILAHLGWAKYRAGGGSPAAASLAQKDLQTAAGMQENLPEAYRYLGTIAFEKEDLGRAMRWLEKCLEWDPKDVDAARLLRLARSRAEKGRGPGASLGALWSKLVKKR